MEESNKTALNIVCGVSGILFIDP